METILPGSEHLTYTYIPFPHEHPKKGRFQSHYAYARPSESHISSLPFTASLESRVGSFLVRIKGAIQPIYPLNRPDGSHLKNTSKKESSWKPFEAGDEDGCHRDGLRDRRA